MERVTVLYSGRVQGVGFRFTVRQLACGYDVTGTVRNLPDGQVELVAEGARAELKAFWTASSKANCPASSPSSMRPGSRPGQSAGFCDRLLKPVTAAPAR